MGSKKNNLGTHNSSILKFIKPFVHIKIDKKLKLVVPKLI
jgi:hypothetical protein